MRFPRSPFRHEKAGAGPFRRRLEYVPVAFWVASFACDLASLRLGQAAVRAAFFLVAGGVTSAILLAATTMQDYSHVPAGSPARTLVLMHAAARAATVVVFACGSWVRASMLNAHFTPVPAVVLSGVGLLLVAWLHTLSHQLMFDRESVVHLVRWEDEVPPPGVIPFRRPRRT
jgi:hypothetical protein